MVGNIGTPSKITLKKDRTPQNYFTSSYPHHYERFMASAATNSRSSRSRGLVVEDVVVIVVVAVVDPVDV